MTSRELNQSALLLLLVGLMLMAGYECIKYSKNEGCPNRKSIIMNGKCYWRSEKKMRKDNVDCGPGEVAVLNDPGDDISKLGKMVSILGAKRVLMIGLTRSGGVNNPNWQWNGDNTNQNNNPNWHPSLAANKEYKKRSCAALYYTNDRKVVFVKRNCDLRYYYLCCAEPDPDLIGDDDPHFLIQSSLARDTHLCFDVDGEDGDVLQLIQDPDHKLQVNGQLFESPSTKIHTALFSAMAVMCGADNIFATKDRDLKKLVPLCLLWVLLPRSYLSPTSVLPRSYLGPTSVLPRSYLGGSRRILHITVNDAPTVQWDDTYDVGLYNKGSVSSKDNSTVGIKLTSDIQIEVTRSKNRKGDTHLGIHITDGDGVGDHAKGIIGKFIRGEFSAISPINKHYPWIIEFPEQAISVPVHRRTRYVSVLQRSVQCWFYKVNTDVSRDDLLGRRSDYTVDDLTYTPF